MAIVERWDIITPGRSSIPADVLCRKVATHYDDV